MCLVYLKGVPFYRVTWTQIGNREECQRVWWYTDTPLWMAPSVWQLCRGLLCLAFAIHTTLSLSLPIRPPLLLPYTGNKLRTVRLRRLSKSCLGCNNPEILALDKHRTLLDILDRFLFIQPGKEHDFLLIVAHSVLQLFMLVLFWVSRSTSTTDVFQLASCCREVWYHCCPSQTLVRPSHVLLISIPLSFSLWSLTHKIFIHSVWPLTSECPPVLETLQGVLQRVRDCAPPPMASFSQCHVTLPFLGHYENVHGIW